MWAVRVGMLLPVWGLSLACAAGLDADPRILTGTLVLDREFSVEQRAEVLRAVEMWSAATEARFAPSVVLGEVTCEQAFAIKAEPARERARTRCGRSRLALGIGRHVARWPRVSQQRRA
jgi:hypothetical protein